MPDETAMVKVLGINGEVTEVPQSDLIMPANPDFIPDSEQGPVCFYPRKLIEAMTDEEFNLYEAKMVQLTARQRALITAEACIKSNHEVFPIWQAAIQEAVGGERAAELLTAAVA